MNLNYVMVETLTIPDVIQIQDTAPFSASLPLIVLLSLWFIENLIVSV